MRLPRRVGGLCSVSFMSDRLRREICASLDLGVSTVKDDNGKSGHVPDDNGIVHLRTFHRTSLSTRHLATSRMGKLLNLGTAFHRSDFFCQFNRAFCQSALFIRPVARSFERANLIGRRFAA